MSRSSVALTVVATVTLAATAAAASGRAGETRQLPRGPWVPSWEVVYGGYQQVGGLAFVGPDEAWGVDVAALGSGSKLRLQTAFVHWSSGIWRAQQIEDGVGLTAIAMADAAFGFAVGPDGAIYRYDGRRWVAEPSPTTVDLTDVALAGRGEGWAVGEHGTILFWDGAAWTPADASIGIARVQAVTAVGPGQAWAVTKAGDVLRFDGSWSRAEAPAGAGQLVDIAFAGPDRGLAVGQSVLELARGRWSKVPTDAQWTSSVAWDGDRAYVVADGAIRAYGDGQWRPVTFAPAPLPIDQLSYQRLVAGGGGVWGLQADGPMVRIDDGVATLARPAVRSFLALDMVGPTFGWAAGETLVQGFVGTRTGQWNEAYPLAAQTVVWDIALVSEQDGWAIGIVPGAPPAARLWRWDGASWSVWPLDKTWRPRGIDMLAADDGWMVAGNVIARWDGEAWRQVADAPLEATSGTLSMLRGGESPEGWFGSYGVIYHLHDWLWESEPLPRQVALHTIEVPSATEGWAAGDDALFRYDGRAWREITLAGGGRPILDLDAPEPGNAWVLVGGDELYHWNGLTWERHTLAPMGAHSKPQRVRAVRYGGDDPVMDVWLAGDPPVIARYRVVAPVSQLFLPALRAAGGG